MSKRTLDSLKSVFNVFRKKPSLGAPDLLYVDNWINTVKDHVEEC